VLQWHCNEKILIFWKEREEEGEEGEKKKINLHKLEEEFRKA